jgi:hypothetical protein
VTGRFALELGAFPGFDQDCHGTCLKTPCTTLVPMPSILPILRMPSPLALNSRIRCSTAGLTRRRPNFAPFALARTSPALIAYASQFDPRGYNVAFFDLNVAQQVIGQSTVRPAVKYDFKGPWAGYDG